MRAIAKALAVKLIVLALLMSCKGVEDNGAGNDSFSLKQKPPPEKPRDDAAIRVNSVQGLDPDFIMGADVSMLRQIERSGGKFYDQTGKEKDCLMLLKERGINWVRLRLWNNPVFAADVVENGVVKVPAGEPVGGGNNDEATTIEIARRARNLGLKVLLDFHYSDFWADPGKQNKPAAWSKMSSAELENALYNYTAGVIGRMKAVGAAPDMVQIGNEINNGMLWPEGQLSGSGAGGYAGLAALLKKGVQAVRDQDSYAGTDKKIKIMIHIANGGDNSLYRKFYSEMVAKAVDFDVIGVSFYPFWHGTMDQLRNNINDISAYFNKDVVVVETAYAYTLAEGDNSKNLFGQTQELAGGYLATLQGQATFLRDIIAAVSNVPNGRGTGVFYWAPDWIPVSGAGWRTNDGNEWENQALFDFAGKELPSLNVFRLVREPRPFAQAVVTSIPQISLKTGVGVAPTLPAAVRAIFSDDSARSLAVAWDNIDASSLGSAGTLSIAGTVSGTSVKANATIVVVANANLVTNPGFESGLTEWDIVDPAAAVALDSNAGNAHAGSNSLKYWAAGAFGFTVQRTFSTLASGKYSFSTWISGGGGENAIQVFADNGVSRKSVAAINTGWGGGGNWHQYTVSDIDVSAGQCTIGIQVNANAGNWGNIDDLELVKQ